MCDSWSSPSQTSLPLNKTLFYTKRLNNPSTRYTVRHTTSRQKAYVAGWYKQSFKLVIYHPTTEWKKTLLFTLPRLYNRYLKILFRFMYKHDQSRLNISSKGYPTPSSWWEGEQGYLSLLLFVDRDRYRQVSVSSCSCSWRAMARENYHCWSNVSIDLEGSFCRCFSESTLFM
jgi:hypothetical protein